VVPEWKFPVWDLLIARSGGCGSAVTVRVVESVSPSVSTRVSLIVFVPAVVYSWLVVGVVVVSSFVPLLSQSHLYWQAFGVQVLVDAEALTFVVKGISPLVGEAVNDALTPLVRIGANRRSSWTLLLPDGAGRCCCPTGTGSRPDR